MLRLSAPGIHDVVCRLLADQPGGRLLDPATGTGSLIPNLLALGYAVEAGDLDPSAYTLASPPCRPLDLAERLPYADASFDVIVCLETLEHLPSPRHALGEFARILRPGGRLVVSTPNVQSLLSRIKFFLWGTLDFFDTLRPGEPAPFWLGKGHISPLHFPVLQHALREAGLSVETIATNRPALESVGARFGARPALRLLTSAAAPLVRLAARTRYPGDPVARVMCDPALLHGETVIIRARRS